MASETSLSSRWEFQKRLCGAVIGQIGKRMVDLERLRDNLKYIRGAGVSHSQSSRSASTSWKH
jgi:hypothetical protein